MGVDGGGGDGHPSRVYRELKEGGISDRSKELTTKGRSSREALQEPGSGLAAQQRQRSMAVVDHKEAETREDDGDNHEAGAGGRGI